MTAPALSLHTARGVLELGGRPWLMGIVNATPDSFSDAGAAPTLKERVELARKNLPAPASMMEGFPHAAIARAPRAPGEENPFEMVSVS